MSDQGYVITMKEFTKTFFQNKFKIILIGIIGLFLGFYISYFSNSEYTAQTEILIDIKKDVENEGALVMMPTYKDLLLSKVTTEMVSKTVGHTVNEQELRQMVDVEITDTSKVMNIIVYANKKEEAIKLTNSIAQTLHEEVQKHFKKTDVIVLNEATVTAETDHNVITILFSAIGFLLFSLAMYALMLVREVYYPKINSIEKVESLNQTTLLTVTNSKKKAVVLDSQNNEFQVLASVLAVKVNKYPVANLLIQRDVKEDTAVFEVAKSYELLNKKVLVVQLNNNQKQPDLAQQKWASYVNNERKIENLIEKKSDLLDTLIVDYSEKLDTMPMNKILFERLLNELQQQYDVLLFTTDIENKNYTFVLSQLIDHTMYVVNARKTSLEQAKQDLKKIEKMNLKILGTVLIQ